MITRITVPQLHANTIDVTITAWRKAVGDPVQPGEIIAELTTDKAAFELESTGCGVLLAILADTKSVVASGYIVAILGEAGETDPDAARANDALMAAYRSEAGSQKPSAAALPSPSALPPTASPSRVRATPRARRIAQERGLDLARIQAETGAAVIDEAVLKPYLSS